MKEEIKSAFERYKDFLGLLVNNTQSWQKAFYERKLTDIKPIEITSVRELFTEEEVKIMTRTVKAKECYKNAFNIAKILSTNNREVRYIEGVAFLSDFGGFPIEHAFNSVDGKYFDATFELLDSLKDNNVEYSVYGDYSVDEVREVLLETKVWGEIYENKVTKLYKEKGR